MGFASTMDDIAKRFSESFEGEIGIRGPAGGVAAFDYVPLIRHFELSLEYEHASEKAIGDIEELKGLFTELEKTNNELAFIFEQGCKKSNWLGLIKQAMEASSYWNAWDAASIKDCRLSSSKQAFEELGNLLNQLQPFEHAM